jgi:chromosome segregation ATPase
LLGSGQWVKVAKPEGNMIKELENEIRDRQKELAEVQKDQAVLRLQPCRGDSEIRKKDEKFDELDRRAKSINDTIRDLTRKRQLLISQSTTRGSYDSPSSSNSS